MTSKAKRHLRGSDMRAIEKNIIRDIEFGNGYKGSHKTVNYSVRDAVQYQGYNQYHYYLWNSNIFSKMANSTIVFSFQNYGTNTTKQRINVFLNKYNCGYVYQKNYVLYYHNNVTDLKLDLSKAYCIDLETKAITTL